MLIGVNKELLYRPILVLENCQRSRQVCELTKNLFLCNSLRSYSSGLIRHIPKANLFSFKLQVWVN